jgi:hypothetical protein
MNSKKITHVGFLITLLVISSVYYFRYVNVIQKIELRVYLDVIFISLVFLIITRIIVLFFTNIIPQDSQWVGASRKLLYFAGITILYIIIIPKLGYYVSTLIFLMGGARMLGVKKPLNLIILSTIFVTVVFLLFDYILNVPFPTGIIK